MRNNLEKCLIKSYDSQGLQSANLAINEPKKGYFYESWAKQYNWRGKLIFNENKAGMLPAKYF